MFKFTKYKKIYFIFSGLLFFGSIIMLGLYGLKPGIDFTGGAILEIEYQNERPANDEIREDLNGLDLGAIYVQPTGEKGVIIRMKDISEEMHENVLAALSQETELIPKEGGKEGEVEMKLNIIGIEEKRFESVGPSIGQELKDKTKFVVFASLAAMIIYIALAFRKIQRPLKSWQYGLVSVISLSHDIFIPLGVFALLGNLYGVEITIPVITAFLAVLGYSINNTVVVFDRMRENLQRRGETFEEIIDLSLNQTLTRQINTSLTTLLVVSAIYLFGGETLKYFALTLILGVAAGTYSSLFISAPLLAVWHRLGRRY